MLLSIKNLSVSIEDKIILNNLSLDIKEGEVHAIMGPNGSGKSTLSNVLAGKEEYNIVSGEVRFKDKNLFDLNIEERDLEWEKKFQIAPHYVYLASSSGIKVGITRGSKGVIR